MSHRFCFDRNESLPALSWCARITADASTIEVEHGPWVDTASDFFAEGAWPGEFCNAAFDRSTHFLGSGGKVIDGEVNFFPPTYPTERLHSVRVGDTQYVSNSLSYLLTASGERLDLNYRFYERDFCTILRGYKKATCVVPTARGNHIELHYHDGFSLARGGEGRRAQRPLPPNYRSFSHYVDYLLETMEAIGRNASDPTRLRQYEWLSTLSLGYDSPACTILARQLGVTRAVNFVGGRHGHEEDASDIARILGIELIQHDRDEYLSMVDFPEAEFLASGNGGDDVVYAPLSSELEATLFLRGDFGDALWAVHSFDVSTHRYGKSTVGGIGGSLCEFRLRVGFIIVPIPLLTFSSLPELDAISKSEEMAPYRISSWYDRPIPRRIIEEAGVTRTMFAQRKEAINQPIWALTNPKDLMTAQSWSDYLEFVRDQCDRKLTLAELLQCAVAECKRILHSKFTYGKLGWYMHRARIDGIIRKRDLDVPIPASACLTGNVARCLFHWGVARSLSRYSSSRFDHSR